MKRVYSICLSFMLFTTVSMSRVRAQEGLRKTSFRVEEKIDLLSKTYYAVTMQHPGLPGSVVVEVHSGVGKKSAKDRAVTIAERLNKLQQSDPQWAIKSRLSVEQRNGQYVVAVPKHSEVDYILTADPKSVKVYRCSSTRQLASTLADRIHNKMTVMFVMPTGKFRAAAEAPPQDVIGLYQESLDLIKQGDNTKAIHQLSTALGIDGLDKIAGITGDPNYVPAKLALASIYIDMPQKLRAARLLLAEVSKVTDLDDDQKELLANLKQKL